MTAEAVVELRICKHLGISEQTFYNLAFEVFDFQASQYADLLPQYLQGTAHEVYVKCQAFRKWFQIEKNENDRHILTFFDMIDRRIRITENQYLELHKMYFEERLIYPNSTVIKVTVQEYKERVSIAA